MKQNKAEDFNSSHKSSCSDANDGFDKKYRKGLLVFRQERNLARQGTMRLRSVGGLLLLLVFIAAQVSVGNEKQQTAGGMEPITETIRAQGITEEGMLSVIPLMKENMQQLGAPSCFGLDTDLSITGDYIVQYRSKNATNELATLKDMTFIQPTDDPVQMIRLSFHEADVFILAPQYRDCHGIEIYAFAVNQGTGHAVQLQFQDESLISNTSYYRPGSIPLVKNNRLVLESTEGPGGEGSPNYKPIRLYQLDLENAVMILAN
ncbi:hypothetical protein [Paenibacillus solani]|uniref:Uncharacterized protein n=1 Tax=Paenibacillus solani TaxID=1705565 RepID=A0A0M1P4G1_9BACL|nr:hypothetical protein [Paenibacillus solani]KOR88924.1 hypothetical protein AM231_06935 [Paenibacillus solani]